MGSNVKYLEFPNVTTPEQVDVNPAFYLSECQRERAKESYPENGISGNDQ